MTPKIYQVDAFTSTPFAGNPAAVCLLDAPAEDAWMQSVAAEMNHSETAFLHPEPDGFRLRWFTPKREVRLCGHATLASAHVLWESGVLQEGEQARFTTLSGLLTARLEGAWIEMDFPARFHTPTPPPEGLLEALGATPVAVYGRENIYLLELENGHRVSPLRPGPLLVGETGEAGDARLSGIRAGRRAASVPGRGTGAVVRAGGDGARWTVGRVMTTSNQAPSTPNAQSV